MTFLYPSFLWALTLLSIPVIIHLFNFRKTRRVLFSNNRFLKQVKEVTTSKRRLKHYLILASRLLFLLFLVFAFAQPVIPAREQMLQGQNIALYIDNSQSMSAQLDDKTRGIETALTFARNIIETLPADTRYKIVTNDFAPFSNNYKTKPEALDILTQVRTSPVSRSFKEINQRIKQGAGNVETFFISDFQRSTLGNVNPLDTVERMHLIPITLGSKPNIFIDTAYLENPFAASGEKNVLKVVLANDGKREVEQLPVKLTLNGVQAGTASVAIAGSGKTETNFDLLTGLGGLNRAIISFNDFPVSFDNEFFVSLNFKDKIQILEIKPSKEATPVEKVFGNNQIFNLSSFSIGNFNYSLLKQADLVVVNGLNTIDASFALSLRSYLNEGGSLLFIPGNKPDVANYQQVLVLPNLRTLTETSEFSELNRPDFSDPFFENVFEERAVSIAMPRAVRMLDWGTDRSAVLQFKNGQPFLSRMQQGNVFVLSTPLQSQFTDFYNHALFVPVMYRIAASSKKSDYPIYYTLQENFISIQSDTVLREKPLKLVGTDEIVPPQRNVGNQIFMEIPKYSVTQGFYYAVSDKDTVNLLAFNLNKAESRLAQYKAEEVRGLLGNGDNITIFEANTSDAFSNEIKARYLGKPLWKYAIMLALAFLLAEILLIRFLK